MTPKSSWRSSRPIVHIIDIPPIIECWEIPVLWWDAASLGTRWYRKHRLDSAWCFCQDTIRRVLARRRYLWHGVITLRHLYRSDGYTSDHSNNCNPIAIMPTRFICIYIYIKPHIRWTIMLLISLLIAHAPPTLASHSLTRVTAKSHLYHSIANQSSDTLSLSLQTLGIVFSAFFFYNGYVIRAEILFSCLVAPSFFISFFFYKRKRL